MEIPQTESQRLRDDCLADSASPRIWLRLGPQLGLAVGSVVTRSWIPRHVYVIFIEEYNTQLHTHTRTTTNTSALSNHLGMFHYMDEKCSLKQHSNRVALEFGTRYDYHQVMRQLRGMGWKGGGVSGIIKKVAGAELVCVMAAGEGVGVVLKCFITFKVLCPTREL